MLMRVNAIQASCLYAYNRNQGRDNGHNGSSKRDQKQKDGENDFSAVILSIQNKQKRD